VSNAELELDEHVKAFKKKAEDTKYTEEVCPVCNSRIDEFGYCACGGQAD